MYLDNYIYIYIIPNHLLSFPIDIHKTKKNWEADNPTRCPPMAKPVKSSLGELGMVNDRHRLIVFKGITTQLYRHTKKKLPYF